VTTSNRERNWYRSRCEKGYSASRDIGWKKEHEDDPTHLNQPTLPSGVDPTREHRPSGLSNLGISIPESVPDHLLPLPNSEPSKVLDLSERESLEVDGSSNRGVDVSSSEEDNGEGSRGEGQGEQGCLTDVAVRS